MRISQCVKHGMKNLSCWKFNLTILISINCFIISLKCKKWTFQIQITLSKTSFFANILLTNFWSKPVMQRSDRGILNRENIVEWNYIVRSVGAWHAFSWLFRFCLILIITYTKYVLNLFKPSARRNKTKLLVLDSVYTKFHVDIKGYVKKQYNN